MPRTLILGLGRFSGGQEAARFLLRRGHALRIADKAGAESLATATKALGEHPAIDWQLGREDDALLDGIDLVVCNPAIPDEHPLRMAAQARGIPLSQEVELFLEHYPGRVVLVTGTNGKSTTTTLLGKALLASGVDTIVGGNIGASLLALEPTWSAQQIAVLEISSFQLERCDPARHRAHGAVLVRITRDHLDRHGTLERYWQAKSRAATLARAFVVHAADDPVASRFETPAPRRVTFTRAAPADGQLGCVDAWLAARLPEHDGLVLHADALRLFGDFHRENALAAFAASLLLGARAHPAALAICGEPPLPHRLQLCGERGGVRIWENSVSTEIESTDSAVRTLSGRVHWVGGGKSKDGDYARVADTLAPRIASAHLFGQSARPLGALLQARVPFTINECVMTALDQAWHAARPGESLLFSPAFASFDQYPNWRARAQDFRAWLTGLREEAAAD